MYSYSPFLRVTPPAGDKVVYDLGSVPTMKIAQWVPEFIFTQKETVRRRLRNIKYGWRLHVILEWVVDVGTAGELTLIDLMSYLARNDSPLEISMNGGATYRDCIVATSPVRDNVEKKNILGLYHMEFTCVDLLSPDSLPPEVVQSPPGLGQWHG